MGVGRKVRVRQIVLRLQGPGSRAQRLHRQLARARALLERLRSGRVSFADLARKVSDDPATRAKGGDLGFVGRGALPPPVETAVFGAKGAGVLVGPVVAEGGVYLLRIEAQKASMALPFDKIKHRLRSQIYNVRAARRTAAWIRSLRQRALVDIRL
jgi:peptidyl-prolyl cis-trans isomerase D